MSVRDPYTIADVIRWQENARLCHISAMNFRDGGMFEPAIALQQDSARYARWAREAMEIEPMTYLD